MSSSFIKNASFLHGSQSLVAASQEKPKSALRPTSKKKSVHQRQPPKYRLFFDDEDVTPRPLNPLVYEDAPEKQLSMYELSDSGLLQTRSEKEVAVFGQQQYLSQLQLQSQLHTQSVTETTSGMQSYITANYDDVSIDDHAASEYSERSVGSAASAEQARADRTKPPSRVVLSLVETETFFLLELSSCTVIKGTDEGDAVEIDNEHYDFLTSAKGRNRKVITAETQTNTVLLKTRHTEAHRPKKKHNYAFASNWAVYDTYKEEEFKTAESDDSDETASVASQNSEETIVATEDDKQMAKLLKNVKFQEVLIVMERLLANNNYNRQQKRFRGLLNPSPFRENIEYTYRLDLLWTFANSDTKGKSVTAIDWNPTNRDVLAVGYGKFAYNDPDIGMVMIWNIKNPVQPERTYHFPAAVTSLQFSRSEGYALAVGLSSGQLEVIDVTQREKRVCRKTSRRESGVYEALWKVFKEHRKVMWYSDDDYYEGEDQIIAACQDGKILKFRRSGTIIYKTLQIMQMARAEGKLKGVEVLRRCAVTGVPVTRYSPALTITRHPVDANVYFVGTGEGVVHRCSTDYFHQHLDLFVAHDGPLYVLKFSPFCNMIYMTCGDDWTARIWCEGISEPLVELRKTLESVQGADWSPMYSTIIATISGSDIHIWDLQRKAYLPQSTTANPAECRNTVVQFTDDGRCLLVADVDGNVHVFALEDMPFPAFFQDDLLAQALARATVNKPEVLRQLKELGRLNFDRAKMGKHFR